MQKTRWGFPTPSLDGTSCPCAMNETMKFLPPNRAVRLHNATCSYCGRRLADTPNDRDHVIGRKFVPKGKLNASWNLIVRCCVPCNNAKSDLEDDVSALSMQPDAFGVFPLDDPDLRIDGSRKATNSVSRRTKKRVADSWESQTIRHKFFPGVTATFSMGAPPQLAPERVAALARLHLVALFYWITYDSSKRTGGFWLGEGVVANFAPKRDWGNSIQRSFADLTQTWEHRIHAIAAEGYFKVSLRRHPSSACWAWALEWNHNIRVVGFVGNNDALQDSTNRLQDPERQLLRTGEGAVLTLRQDVALDDGDDRLFTL